MNFARSINAIRAIYKFLVNDMHNNNTKVVSSVQECLDRIMNFLWLWLIAQSNMSAH